ncbi:MAG: Abi-alpha family protein [Bacteriodetes bacterium]|nr:Abi-alpha family protein [Bacteroidota bacterium]
MNDLDKIQEKFISDGMKEVAHFIRQVLDNPLKETGELITDYIRNQRAINQIKLIQNLKKKIGNEKLEEVNLNKINLKVLYPLLENASLENDQDLQELWANLLSNIVQVNAPDLIQNSAIKILKSITNDEVRILKYLYDNVISERKKRSQTHIDFFGSKEIKPTDYKSEDIEVTIFSIISNSKIDEEQLFLLISNLVSLGVIKYLTEVDINYANKSDVDPSNTSLDIDLYVANHDKICLTKLGFSFVELCTTSIQNNPNEEL